MMRRARTGWAPSPSEIADRLPLFRAAERASQVNRSRRRLQSFSPLACSHFQSKRPMGLANTSSPLPLRRPLAAVLSESGNVELASANQAIRTPIFAWRLAGIGEAPTPNDCNGPEGNDALPSKAASRSEMPDLHFQSLPRTARATFETRHQRRSEPQKHHDKADHGNGQAGSKRRRAPACRNDGRRRMEGTPAQW
jgi:hypothetical protein